MNYDIGSNVFILVIIVLFVVSCEKGSDRALEREKMKMMQPATQPAQKKP